MRSGAFGPCPSGLVNKGSRSPADRFHGAPRGRRVIALGGYLVEVQRACCIMRQSSGYPPREHLEGIRSLPSESVDVSAAAAQCSKFGGYTPGKCSTLRYSRFTRLRLRVLVLAGPKGEYSWVEVWRSKE